MGVRNMAHQRPPPQDGQWHPELLYPGDVGEKAKTSRAMAGMEPYAPRGAGPAPKETFAGHVARHDCPARDVMLWRNLEWWRGQQALSARVGARHPHQYNATVDVERQLSAVATEQWMQLAGDRLRWYHLQEEFVRKWTSRGTTRRTAAQTVFSDRHFLHFIYTPPLVSTSYSLSPMYICHAKGWSQGTSPVEEHSNTRCQLASSLRRPHDDGSLGNHGKTGGPS